MFGIFKMDTMALIRMLSKFHLAQIVPRKSRLIFKITCFLLLLFLVALHLHTDFMRSFEVDRDIMHRQNHFGLILDTPGCKVPKLDPYDESVRNLIVAKKPYVCHGDPVFLVIMPNSTVVLDDHILETAYGVPPENISCSYTAIFRDKERDGYIGEDLIKFGVSKRLQFGIPLSEEFIKVECKLGPKIFSQYLPLVPIKPEVEKRASKAETKRGNSLNVILIGIDSVSKLNFLRHFKKTESFLVTNMSAFDMKGYTKVGDNTFPNLVPLLTGHFVEHYWNESVKDEMFFDSLDFIWKSYASRGYSTFYAEDSPFTGTFNYLKRGFEHPPTDYYFRTIGLAIQNSELRKNGSGYCLNNQLETEIIYNYLKDYVKTMKDRPHFSFTMVSTLTHDKLNDAGYCDEPTYNLLKELWESGVTNRSMVIIFSDHGLRFGKIRETYIGKFEERMPFMYLTLPRWFLEKYENIWENLKANQNRLITLFDVHATLRHLLDVTKAISEEASSSDTPNGFSLFGEISEYRTCEMAEILPHWCPCQVYQYVPTNDTNVIEAATEIVCSINGQLEAFGDVCAYLEVDEITDARVRQANNKVLEFVRHENDVLNRRVVYGNKVETLADFLITLRTRPGGALFEGTVRHDMTHDSYKVVGISRINMYGSQSTCIDSQILKKICFCK